MEEESYEPSNKWDAELALKSLVFEAEMHGESEQQTASRVFRENLPLAAQAICHVARYAPNERIRLDAAKYVVERNLGRLADVQPTSTEDPFEKLLAEVVVETTRKPANDPVV